MVEAGQIALPIALLTALYAAVASFAAAWRRIPELSVSGRYAFYAVPLLLVVSSAALVYAFVTSDFSVRYVAENSNLAMPRAYTWVAFYAGNAGSLLFLAGVFSAIATVAVLSIRRRLPYTAPYATAIMALVLAFFLAIIVFFANPLERLSLGPSRRPGHQPAAGALRHVHPSAHADDRSGRRRYPVQHRDGRAARAARRDATSGWTWAGPGP